MNLRLDGGLCSTKLSWNTGSADLLDECSPDTIDIRAFVDEQRTTNRGPGLFKTRKSDHAVLIERQLQALKHRAFDDQVVSMPGLLLLDHTQKVRRQLLGLLLIPLRLRLGLLLLLALPLLLLLLPLRCCCCCCCCG